VFLNGVFSCEPGPGRTSRKERLDIDKGTPALSMKIGIPAAGWFSRIQPEVSVRRSTCYTCQLTCSDPPPFSAATAFDVQNPFHMDMWIEGCLSVGQRLEQQTLLPALVTASHQGVNVNFHPMAGILLWSVVEKV
jgi:hypothetical protein